ncbi:MAG: hypothetical protein GKR93_03970 [Gammaproteobacteria bacterium]|nr:hypothetical protein [Gammaproteobacteria bacterium]
MALSGLSIGIFRPGLLPTALTFILLVLLSKLGFWQLDRAKQKETLKEQVVEQQKLPPLSYLPEGVENSSSLLWRRASLQGVSKTDIVFLLDNQVYQGQAGYFVYTVLKQEGGLNLLVNRGWIKAGLSRETVRVPDISGSTETLTGVIKAPPATGLLLAEDTEESLSNGVVRLQQINPAKINERYHMDIAPYVFRLEPPSTSGFIRDWTAPGFGREKHLGYAFQWFAMAFALFIIYIVVNTNRIKNDE